MAIANKVGRTCWNCMTRVLLMMSLAASLHTSRAAAGVVTHKQYNANIKGTVLVLDVGGLHHLGNRPSGPLITYPSACRGRCDRTPGCTGWTLCNQETGCGSACYAYDKAHPTTYKSANLNKHYVGNYKASGFGFPPDAKLPIESFGGFSGGSRCNGVTDKWPWGLCSMKAVAKPTKPQFFSTYAADGWVSGVVLLPPSCKGVSAITCKQCLASKDPKGCLACAKAAARVAEIGNVADFNSTHPTWTEGCAACTTLSGGNRALCYKCLTSGSMCGNCAVEPYRWQKPTKYFNLVSCLSCTKKNPRTYEECQACARLKAPAAQKKCNECISKLGAVLDVLPYQHDKRRMQTGDFCSKCAQALPVADRCIKCGKEMPYNDDCWGCVSSDVNPSSRNRCYDCAFKAKLGQDSNEVFRRNTVYSGGQCKQCLQKTSISPLSSSRPVATSLKGQCFACLTDPKVTGKAKYWCNRCYTQAKTAQGRSKCLACLKKAGKKDYATCPVS